MMLADAAAAREDVAPGTRAPSRRLGARGERM